MRAACTLALLATALLPGAARAWAGVPRRLELRATPRPLEVRTAAQAASVLALSKPGNRALRALPVPLERPGPYAAVSRWIGEVATPGPDGKPKLVVMPVRGGLGLAWARSW
jgi:hypothetical protein